MGDVLLDQELDALIHSDAKMIKLESDVVLDSEPIKIDVDGLVIDGNNHFIDAKCKTQIFHVTGENIVLKNIIFENAYSKKSGAAIFNFKNKLTLINCKFINNVSFESDGGAICNRKGFLTIENCVFTDNSSKNGGAIFNGNSMEISNCSFSNNNSQELGFSIFNNSQSDLTLKNSNFNHGMDSIFEDNPLNNEIFNKGIINVENNEKKFFKSMIKGGFLHVISDNVKFSKVLKNLINKGRKEIDFDFDIDFEDEESKIVIDVDDLIIDGNGHAIDALAKSSILTVNSENVTLKNINFRNANSKYGGLLINENCSLNLINCNFENNISENGGAINNEGAVSVESCNFENNVSITDFGGAINNNGELTLIECKFNNNISNNAGGAINNFNYLDLQDCRFKSNISEQGGAINNMSGGLINVINCFFEKNYAFKQGSIIYNDAYLNIKGSGFSDNYSILEKHSDKSSHAIYHKGDEDSELLIENCNFSQNLIDNNLIYLEEGFCTIYSSKFDINDGFYIIHNQNANLRFEKSKFINSNRNAIFNEGILNLRKEDKIEAMIRNNGKLNYIGEKTPEDWIGFTYLDNLIHSGSNHVTLDSDILMHFSEQDYYESGIEIDVDGLVIDGDYHTVDANNFSRIFIISAKNVVIKNIKFKNGKYFKSKFDGENAGGGAIYALPESFVEIDHCIFSQNKSRESAGAILNKSKSFKINNALFDNNHARNKGGAIFNENSTVEMSKCSFINNFSSCSAGVYNENTPLKMSHIIFKDNLANKCGALLNYNSSIKLDDCKFAGNSSDDCAGAILNYRNNCEFNNCKFLKNNSKGQGGAIYNKLGQINLNNCTFSNNSSKSEGGGIFNINGSLMFVDCDFKNNSAFNRGGSIENKFDNNFSFTMVESEENTFNSIINLINSKFSENSAKDGGAVSNMKKCKLVLENCHFENNEARDNAGAIYNYYGILDGSNTNFSANISKNYAGAIDNHFGSINLKKSKFSDNNVRRDGGAIYNGGILNSIDECIFENNHALLKGGAICTTKSSCGKISNSQFRLNNAHGNGGFGGAIYNKSFSNGKDRFSLDLIDCNFLNNYANDDGGAIFNKGHLNLNYCNFKDNTTDKKGKTLKNEGENVGISILDSNFDDEIQ